MKTQPSAYSTGAVVMATIGPTLETLDAVKSAIDAGACWFRLPMGYRFRDHVTHARLVREAAGERDVLLLADLPSERLRVGTIDDTSLEPGAEIWMFDPDEAQDGSSQDISCPVPGLGAFLDSIKEGAVVSLLDGRISLVVAGVSSSGMTVRVVEGKGTMKSSNAVVFPGGEVEPGLIGKEDRAILEKMAKAGAVPDWIALSMVASASQLPPARRELESILGFPVKIMAKIETASALLERKQIVEKADGIMVARGDLGQVVDPAEVPEIQRTWVATARAAGKPVVVATQFLECFAEAGFPQRCELTDLATAAEQGSTAIMLGKETVYSKRPIEAVELAMRCLAVGGEPRIPGEIFDRDPRQLRDGRPAPPLLALEGGNGVGKSTALEMLLRRDPARKARLGVPEQWMRPEMKMRMIRDADWMASALYFLSGTIELSREIVEGSDEERPSILFLDRCIWSTLAVHAAHDPSRLSRLVPLLRTLAGHVCVPEKTIVLTASLETLWKRISEKSEDEAAYDLLTQNFDYWKRELAFYEWLQGALEELQMEGVGLHFIATDDLAPEDVVERIEVIAES